MTTSQEYAERFEGYVPREKDDAPIWETKLPFGIEPGDGTLIAKALRAYRPETSEEESLVDFFAHEFEKLDQSKST